MKNDKEVMNRACGCMMGLMVGDALGSPVEFMTTEEMEEKIPEGVTEMMAGVSVLERTPGEITDDSEMAICLAKTLVENQGYSSVSAKKNYLDWLFSSPPDVGMTTSKGLKGIKSPLSESNGALMRIAPLGIYAALHPTFDWEKAVKEDTVITHVNPICVDINLLVVKGIILAIQGKLNKKDLYDNCLQWGKDQKLSASVIDVMEKSEIARPTHYYHNMGWVLIAFQNMWYEFLHSYSVEKGIESTVAHGGDTDTNAAVTGSLLGAFYGLDLIPEEWKKSVLTNPETYGPSRPEWLHATEGMKLIEVMCS